MRGHETAARRAAVNWIVPLCIIVFCACAYFLTTEFDRVPPILKRGMQPADFPQLVIMLMGFLALWLAFVDKSTAPTPLPPVVYASLGMMAGFLGLAQVDLFLALGVFGFCLTLIWGERRWWALAIVAVVVPFGVFLLFDQAFDIRFPRGLLTNLWYG